MSIPERYAQLVDVTSQDRDRLNRLDEEIKLRAHILNEGPAGLEALQTQRNTLALDVEVSEAMLMHAQRTYDIPGLGAPGPHSTQDNPVLTVGAAEVEIVNPEGKAGLSQMLNIRRPRQAPGEGVADHG